MIIDLPTRNLRANNFLIKDGILFIRNRLSLKRVMSSLTYQMKGRRKCFYCHEKFLPSQMTLDHLYPQEIGGPTITNNLVPCCNECNGRKANMTQEEYFVFSHLGSTDEKLKYSIELSVRRKEFQKKGLYGLPAEWLQETPTNRIKFHTIKISEEEYSRKQEKFLECGHLPKPIVVDRKLNLLDGVHWLIIARNYDIKTVNVIKLDNVELIGAKRLEDLISKG